MTAFKNQWGYGIRYATHSDMKATRFEAIEVFYNRKRQHQRWVTRRSFDLSFTIVRLTLAVATTFLNPTGKIRRAEVCR